MKKVLFTLLISFLFPLTAFANDSFLYLSVCNMLNSWGSNGGPLKHNLSYSVKTSNSVYESVDLNAQLPWNGNSTADVCKTAQIFSHDNYPLSVELTITDVPTNAVVWHGNITKYDENSDLVFGNKQSSVNLFGRMVYFHYFPTEIAVTRY